MPAVQPPRRRSFPAPRPEIRALPVSRKLGAEPARGSPDDMQRYVFTEAEKWGKVAKFAGIKPE
jgi:hypothetical protein